jgi:copper chaperone CopZ
MADTILRVEGMTCAHCGAHVSQALRALPGVRGVSVDVSSGVVTVSHEGKLDLGAARVAVEDAGYRLVEG